MDRSVPYVFEDRTAAVSDTDFDDLYDRLFFKVARMSNTDRAITTIYEMRHRASRHRDRLPFHGLPTVNLEFGPNETLGTVSFLRTHQRIEMSRYLRKTSLFGGSLSRRFTASDGVEYRWSYQTQPGQQWTCTTASSNQIVAHYNLKPPNERAYGVSGNNLTIYEPYADLIIEILASFTIMRHIAHYSL